MKKIDSLLQKAALFEKLAVYGDRGSFLHALAQNRFEDPDLAKYQKEQGNYYGDRPGIPAPEPAEIGPSLLGGQSKQDPASPGANIKDYSKPAPVTNTGPAVTQIQDDLNYILFGDPNNRLMLQPIKNDGIFGDETKGAVRLFKEKFPRAASLNGPALYNYLHQLAESIRAPEAMKKQQQAQLEAGPAIKT